MSRRQAIGMGGGLLVALSLPLRTPRADDIVEIGMGGRKDGAEVWFDPIGVLVQPGQTIRWKNLDKGNTHTATAYHPANFDRPPRIPQGAEPWDSGYLLPGESYSVTLSEPGIYDYYCLPHEHAGMVGRIIVDQPDAHGWPKVPGADADLPEIAIKGFPAIEEIMEKRIVRRT